MKSLVQKLVSILLVTCWGSLAFERHELFRSCVVEGTRSERMQQQADFKYAVLSSLLDCYKRDFTLCYVGSKGIEVPFSVAEQYDATAVIISPDEDDAIARCCASMPGGQRTVLLKKQMTCDEVHRLSECEHFDVTIVQDPLEQYQANPLQSLAAFLQFGDHVIIERVVNYQDDAQSTDFNEQIDVVLHAAGAKLFAQIDKKGSAKTIQWLLVKQEKKSLMRVNWRRKEALAPGKYLVNSTFEKKELFKTTNQQTTQWLRGINLRTYTGLNGTHPSHETVLSNIWTMRNLDHNDFLPCNLIVQGNLLIPIDFGDARRKLNFAKGFERCMNMFNTKENWVTYNLALCTSAPTYHLANSQQ